MGIQLFWLQVIFITLFIYFISGRIIGPNVNFTKRLLSVICSAALSTIVFWYSYLQKINLQEMNFKSSEINLALLLWVGAMLLISMLFYLFFELFDPMQLAEDGTRLANNGPFYKRFIVHWRRQKRLRQVLSIAMRNGITRTVKYAQRRDAENELAKALRDTLEQCGGLFIKFGQVLSTRKDLFSPTFIEELEKLQQNVSPVAPSIIKESLEKNLTRPIEEVFSYFNYEPLASASIGQVHKAILKETNEPVVVKIIRPDIKRILKNDLSILVEFANFISSKSQWAENLGFRELAIGFAHALQEEINFEIEARNMLQIHAVLDEKELKVEVPKVYAKYSNESILVMSYMEGVKINSPIVYTQYSQEQRKKFAQDILNSFLNQVFVSGIFHADPHPGNIFINLKTDKVALLDFGAVGRLTEYQQQGIKLFLLGISQVNAEVVVDGIILLVENADEADQLKMEQAVAEILLKISYVSHIATDELIYALFTIVRQYGLHFYPSVNMALRAFVTLDGTLKVVEPTFEIFEEAQTFSSDYVKKAIKRPFTEPVRTFERLEEEISILIPNLKRIPRRFDQFFKKIESGKVILHHDIFSDKANASFIKQLFSQFILLMVGITFGIISVALLAISMMMHSVYAIYVNMVAYLGLYLCAILLVRLSIQAIREMKKI